MAAAFAHTGRLRKQGNPAAHVGIVGGGKASSLATLTQFTDNIAAREAVLAITEVANKAATDTSLGWGIILTPVVNRYQCLLDLVSMTVSPDTTGHD